MDFWSIFVGQLGWQFLLTALLVLYVLSPIDLLPEIILGPVGFTDDAIAILGIVWVWFGGIILAWAKTGIAQAIIAIVGVAAGLYLFTRLLGSLFRGVGAGPKGYVGGGFGMHQIDPVRLHNVPTNVGSFIRIHWR